MIQKNPDGFKEALKLFKESARRVPAYKLFLRKNKINPARIKSYQDFQKVPSVDKKNYILRRNWRDLFCGTKYPPMLYASSGSSGKPTFWFRSDEQERAGADIHEKIFRDIFKIKKNEATLVVVCFSMGLWIAGNYTLSSLREVARRGYNNMTIATPGIEKEDIISVVKNIAPRFKNIVFAGYPSFLMYIFDDLKKQRVKLPKNTRVITAGDKFSENWRNAMLGIIKAGDRLGSVIGIYGSADAAAMGYETPFSIAIRKIADKNAEFRRKLFGDGVAVLPALVQYDPQKVFFERMGEELILTVRTPAPLIRYNIHDVGRVLPYKDMLGLLKTQKNIKIPAGLFGQWKEPFLFIKSRTDVAVTFYAINIFPEHLTAGIVDSRVKKFFSGSFTVYNKNVRKEKEERLYINLELAPGIRASKTIRNKAEKSIIANFCELSIEYRKLFSAIRERAIPVVKLHAYGHESFTRFLPGRTLVRVEGKKPKIILKQ